MKALPTTSAFLGHLVDEEGACPDPAKIRAVAKWPEPNTIKEMQSFHGFVNFYRDYIANAAETAAPLCESTASENYA